MAECAACGATVSDSAAFCGECGHDLSATSSPGGEGPTEAGEQIKQRVREEREAESGGGIGTRLKGFGYLIGGVVALVFGYWIGFVGYTEMQMGPQGFGAYQITYPIAGLIVLAFGGLMVVAGLAGLAGMDLSD